MTDSISELPHILVQHARRYPAMQPTDAVKLIYQNEFGGGHLIRDARACLDGLEREYAAVLPDARLPRFEQIGNGILRVNLAALKAEDLPWLGSAFLRSAAAHTGSMERFWEKLAVLRRVVEEDSFFFGTEALAAYLDGYGAAGYPAVSHSPEYKAAYRPAYRVVLRETLPDLGGDR